MPTKLTPPVVNPPQNRAERRTQARNLVPVSTWEQRQPNFKRSTLYKWAHLRRFPGLFIKISGRLFVDEDIFDRIAEEGRQG
jgi:hypothetical protein